MPQLGNKPYTPQYRLSLEESIDLDNVQLKINKSENKVRKYIKNFLDPSNYNKTTNWLRHKISSKLKNRDLYLLNNSTVGFIKKCNINIDGISEEIFLDDRLVKAFYRREDRETLATSEINAFIKYLKAKNIFVVKDTSQYNNKKESSDFIEATFTNNITGEKLTINVAPDTDLSKLDEFNKQVAKTIAEKTRNDLIEHLNSIEIT